MVDHSRMVDKTRPFVKWYLLIVARRATIEDALAIATIHVRSWQAAYEDVFPADWLEGLKPEDRLPGRERMLRTPRERSETIVVERNGRVVGFADVGLARDTDLDEETGEVFTCYIDPPYWRSGCGSELMKAVQQALVVTGYSSAVLWVLGTNDAAIALYRSLGWQIDGVEKTDSWAGVGVPEVRMRLRFKGTEVTPGAT